jgi:hypothetical protein
MEDLFRKCHAEFEENFDGDRADEISIICFGITGAGKSTFLARLLSDLSPTNFMREIKSENDFSEIMGIKIGHKAPSTTLVPRRYDVGGMGVFDVPGFKDLDGNKQVVINILHKCLLNKVRSAKFLAVLDVRILFNAKRFSILIDDYHNKMKELFGPENYLAAIENIHFFLTHNDKLEHPVTTEEVHKRMKSKYSEIVDMRNEHLKDFWKRLHSNFFLLDYTTQDQGMLTEKLKRICEGEMPSDGIAAKRMLTRQLSVHANKLNMKCDNKMDKIVTDIDNEWKSTLSQFTNKRDELEMDTKTIAKDRTTVSNLNANIAQMKVDVKEAEWTIGVNDEEVITLDDKIARATASRDEFVGLQDSVDRQLEDVMSVSVRQDVARKTASFPTAVYEFKSVIGMEPELHQRSTILVIRHEVNDPTLRKHIRNEGTLLPVHINTIKNFAHDIVLFNSAQRICSEGLINKVDYDPSKNHLHMHFRFGSAFKVLIYTALNFNTTMASHKLHDHYNRRLDEMNTVIQQHEARREDTKTKSADLADLIKQTTIKLTVAQAAVEGADKECFQHVTDFAEKKETLDKEVRAYEDVVLRYDESDDVQTICEIGAIFKRNGLDSDVTKKIERFTMLLNDIKSRLTRHEAEVEELAAAAIQE